MKITPIDMEKIRICDFTEDGIASPMKLLATKINEIISVINEMHVGEESEMLPINEE